jgi:hypothetical protein
MHGNEGLPGQRLSVVIQEARGLTTYPEVAWDSWQWDVRRYDKNQRAHNANTGRLSFIRRRSTPSAPIVPFASDFADMAKAVIRTRASQRNVGAQTQTTMLIAFRFLYEKLLFSQTSDPTRLTRRHFQLALEHIRTECTEGSAYALANALSEIARFFDNHCLTPMRIRWQNPMKRPIIGDGLDAASQAAGIKRMPAPDALDFLATISSCPANDNERTLLRIVDLLVVAGFRIGEALTLPLACWVEQEVHDSNGYAKISIESGEPLKRCGLRYWPEKGGDPVVKWLPDCAVPLARRAVAELTDLCSKAREVAAVLERYPNRVPLPGTRHPNQLFSINQLLQILPFRRRSSMWRFLAKDLAGC